jgi:hypothetical protein
MKRVFGIALSCTVGLVCLLPSAALGAGYVTYVGCSPAANAVPSHVCQIGDEPGAFFESPEAEVEYEVCVTFPGETEICAEEEEAEEGVLYVNAITTEIPGNHLVQWYVEGVEVGAWTFRMDAPASPAPTAIVTTPPPVVVPPASGPNLACQSARHRVKKLKTKLQAAETAKAKRGIRKSLRKAKSAAALAC